jgi:hypothetical protein
MFFLLFLLDDRRIRIRTHNTAELKFSNISTGSFLHLTIFFCPLLIRCVKKREVFDIVQNHVFFQARKIRRMCPQEEKVLDKFIF